MVLASLFLHWVGCCQKQVLRPSKFLLSTYLLKVITTVSYCIVQASFILYLLYLHKYNYSIYISTITFEYYHIMIGEQPIVLFHNRFKVLMKSHSCSIFYALRFHKKFYAIFIICIHTYYEDSQYVVCTISLYIL